MRVTLTLPPGHDRIVPSLADYGLPLLVEAGQTIDVPDELAGTGPSWQPVPDDMDHNDRSFFRFRTVLDNGAVVEHPGHLRFDPGPDAPGRHEYENLGHGLLAQPGVWAAADDEQEEG